MTVALPLATPAAGASGAASTTTTTIPPASAELLLDVDTGRVLYEQDAHTLMRPGSLTKMLVAMIAVDWLPADAEIPVTSVAAGAYPDDVGMKAGQKWPLSTTLHALITDSANDAAYALAVDIGGSLAGFAPIMSYAATRLGITDHPVLEDPAGLDRSEGFDGGNEISAWDLAIIGRDMMANPELATIARQQTYDFTGPDGIAYHLVSRNLHFLEAYPGAIGVKTGFTDAAGYCDVEEAERDGRKMLAVVLHGANPDSTAAQLIDRGFGTPVAEESADPVLPAVTEPEPPPPPPPPTTTTSTTTTLPPKQPSGHHLAMAGAAGGVVVLAAAAAVWLDRRRHPGPKHRRRRKSNMGGPSPEEPPTV